MTGLSYSTLSLLLLLVILVAYGIYFFLRILPVKNSNYIANASFWWIVLISTMGLMI